MFAFTCKRYTISKAHSEVCLTIFAFFTSFCAACLDRIMHVYHRHVHVVSAVQHTTCTLNE